MPSQKNIKLFKETKEKIERAGAIFFIDYQGLTHKQLEEVRIVFKEINSELSIIKNTLVNLALKEANLNVDYVFAGPLALLFSFEDAVKTAKALYDFLKKYNLITEGSKIKFGLLDGKMISGKDILVLANLPTRNVLLGKFVNVLASPLTKLVYNLNWNIQKLVLTLDAIKGQKSN